MHYKVLLSIASACALSSNGSLFAMTELRIKNINLKDIETTGESFRCCEQIYETCKEKDYCKECGHCSFLPHCCFSGDCIALCKDDIANYFPMIIESCADKDYALALLVAVAYPPAHLNYHFEHAEKKRATKIESKKMQ
jgi:hypothetical protein